MKFTISAIALAASILATASASPLVARAQCGVTPSGSSSQQPLQETTTNTAEECKELCDANASCQSFVFGLEDNANAPTCKLYSVPASEVPKQDDNLEAYDVGCTNVPTNQPTTQDPQGSSGSNTSGSGSQSGNNPNPQATTTTTTTTSATTQATGAANNNPQGSGSGAQGSGAQGGGAQGGGAQSGGAPQ